MKAEEEGKGFADLDITRRIVFGADHSQTFNKAITDVKLVEKYKNRLFKEKVCTEYGVFKESGVFNNKVTFFADFFVKTSEADSEYIKTYCAVTLLPSGVQEADELRTSCNAIYRVHVRPLNRCPPTLPFLSPYFTFLYVLTPVRATHWKIPEIYNFSAIRTVYEKMQTVMDFEKDNIYFPKVELKREPVDIIERLIQILENGERITHENAVKYYENFVSVDKNWTDSFKRKADQADEDDEEESQPLLMSSDPKDQ
ncbi:hypothetical protein QR680_007532 [Steinernema hermaphroditum]|uniref:Uncharacterized protein n=1 Tax=Steinernema hermaphroditum TaxID=289476 RepID=A0AA39M6J8_9BILA|nr:hypothetical protein QR680_007532 [Steinernema hermaphroditum]